MAAEEQPKIIFSMNRVSKIYPPNKQVLKDIWLSFFYGAKMVFGNTTTPNNSIFNFSICNDGEHISTP